MKNISIELFMKGIGAVIILLLSLIAYYQKETNDFAKEQYRITQQLILADTLRDLQYSGLTNKDERNSEEIKNVEKQVKFHDTLMLRHGWISYK